MLDRHHIINVQGAIFHDGHYLFARRGAGEEYLPGIMDFPGGTIEAGDENDNDVLHNTLIREIQEEVGVRVDCLQYVVSTAFMASDDTPVINIVFLCRYVEGHARVIDSDEVAEVMWMTAEQALKHPDIQLWTKDYLERCESLRLDI